MGDEPTLADFQMRIMEAIVDLLTQVEALFRAFNALA